jgi:hypothetical protein
VGIRDLASDTRREEIRVGVASDRTAGASHPADRVTS